MNNVTESLEKKRERIAKTIRREETDKVPFMVIADTYIPAYFGVRLNEVDSYEKAAELNKRFYEELQYDAAGAMFFPNNVYTAPLLKTLGGGSHVVVDGIKQINPQSVGILEPDEYPQLIKDPMNYLLETVLPRRFQMLNIEDPEERFEKMKELLFINGGFGEYFNSYEKNGIPLLAGAAYYFNPLDFILDVFRNFTGISYDIRRCPELLRDAGLALVDSILAMCSAIQPNEYNAVLVPMHLPPFIKPKDFEKVYWPSYEILTKGILAQGHNICFAFEKNYTHLYDYLQELPNKGIIGMFEEDDIRKVKKRLGNTMAIAGGLSTKLLRFGTKEECIDHVKGLIDDLGPGGGYFITNDSPLCFPGDAKPENLKAVADYINEHGYRK